MSSVTILYTCPPRAALARPTRPCRQVSYMNNTIWLTGAGGGGERILSYVRLNIGSVLVSLRDIRVILLVTLERMYANGSVRAARDKLLYQDCLIRPILPAGRGPHAPELGCTGFALVSDFFSPPWSRCKFQPCFLFDERSIERSATKGFQEIRILDAF